MERQRNDSPEAFAFAIVEEMKIVVVADHAGFRLKEEIRDWLETEGYPIEDVGTWSEESADYPPLAHQAATLVARDPGSRGIFFCGSGNGMALVANKVDGIRAISAQGTSEVRAAREDGNINVLALGARVLIEEEARSIIEVFLETEFAGEARHLRRLEQIEEIEEGR